MEPKEVREELFLLKKRWNRGEITQEVYLAEKAEMEAMLRDLRGEIQDRGEARRGGHGCRLPGKGHPARPSGVPQGDPARTRRGRGHREEVLNEARVGMSLAHENFVRMHDAGRSGGLLSLSIRRKSLSTRWMRRNGRRREGPAKRRRRSAGRKENGRPARRWRAGRGRVRAEPCPQVSASTSSSPTRPRTSSPAPWSCAPASAWIPRRGGRTKSD